MFKNRLRPPVAKAKLRSALTSIAIFAFIFSLLTPQVAHSANESDFDAGNIISDSIFYNGNAMSASEIQTFLDKKVPRCTIGDIGRTSGMAWGNTQIAKTCLRNFSMNTVRIAADRYCSIYNEGSRESAAQIISKVAKSCGISPKVLLVTLEKEQSLVTDSWPTVRQINVAMGANCPDSGPNWSANCDPRYYGFQKQVHRAAWLLKYYDLNPTQYRFRVGQLNKIQYHPDPNCGTRNVYIVNRATAALYIYTPYVPNAAALSNLYGSGNSCSAYGNRNFWRLFTDFFGSTRFSTSGVIGQKYSQLGGTKSWLGEISNSQICPSSGRCWQQFANGRIYSTPAGAFATRAEFITLWRAQPDAMRALGTPTSDPSSTTNTYTQTFEGGAITVTNGVGAITASNNPWTAALIKNTWLGKSTQNKICNKTSGRCWQQFANGRIYSTPAGAFATRAEFITLWRAQPDAMRALGAPTSDPSSTSNTYTQTFEGGTITVTNGIPAISS